MRFVARCWALVTLVVTSFVAGGYALGVCDGSVELLITEFMALNSGTVADQNDDFPDWLEIYNPCLPTVDLAGWYLTDEASNLSKWQFPSVNLGRGEFLLIFASGKNRAVAGAELHTNFKLSSQPEYLALVKPDGITVAHEFAPGYPAQYNDVSYGLPQTASNLVSTGGIVTYRIPTIDDAPAGTGWTAVGYDDSSWDTGPTGLGFTAGGTSSFDVTVYYANIPVPDLGTAEAVLSDPLTQESVEIGSASLINYLDTGNSGNFGNDNPFPGIEIGDDADDFVTLVTGTILIPTAGLWTFGVNSDDGFSLQLSREPWVFFSSFPTTRGASDTLAVFDIPQAGAYSVRLLQFERGSQASLEFFAAEGDHSSFSGSFHLVGDASGGGLELAGIGSSIGTDLSMSMQGVNSSLWCRADFDVADPGVLANLALNVSYEDGFVAYLNGTEVAGANAPDPALWDSTALTDRLDADGGIPERFDLTDFLYLMQPGPNLLAVHGLNDSVANADFLVLPELDAVEETSISDPLAYFPDPTPGTFNAPVGFVGVSPGPQFSHANGMYTDPFSLTLTAASGVIRYTLDGSDPTETHGSEYTAPILVESSTRVRARIFEPGFAPGPIGTGLYTMLDADVLDFDSNLPIVVVNTFGGGLNHTWLTESLTAVVPATAGRAAITDPPEFVGLTGIRTRGSSSSGFPKKQYFLEAWDNDRQDLDVTLLDFPSEADFILNGPYSDKALMRNVLSYKWSNDIDRYAVRTQFVEMFLSNESDVVSSEDHDGVYVLMEKIKRDANRVAITKLGPFDNAPPAVTGGYIIKKDRLDPGDAGFLTSSGHRLAYVEPKEEEITTPQADYIQGYVDDFETALFGPDFDDPDVGYAAYIDRDSFIDHHILVEMTKNIDGYRLSTFLFKDREAKLQMGPIWDYNLSLGNANYLEGWLSEGWYYSELHISNYPWFGRLFEDEAFQLRYADRWYEFRRGPFRTERLLADIDNHAALLDEAQERNFLRWPVLGTYVWPNWFIADTFQEEIDWMKQWLAARLEWIDDQFFAPPEFSFPSGSIPVGSILTIETPTGVVYYTFDGTDPRHAGGGISSTALGCPVPLLLTGETRIMARIWDGGTWSALNEATFEPVPAAFVNELLPLNLSTRMDEQEEFDPWIELYNPSTVPVDLGGLFLTDDLAAPTQWPIPAGTTTCGNGWLVIWADGEPGDGPLHTSFALDPAGGTVWLMNDAGVPIDSLTYPALTDNESFGRRPDGSSLTGEFGYATPGGANPGATTPLILNEYNAVPPDKSLNGSDLFWGQVPGNGGDWFELLVVEDHLDLRGWKVIVEDLDGAISVTLTFTDASVLSDLRSGTILTVSETLPSNIGYDPVNGDWWINLKSGSSGDGLYISALDFSVSHQESHITLLDSADALVFGPVGEGIHPVSGVGNDEVFKLEEDPGPFITPFSNYSGGSSSTFGAPNQWNGGNSEQSLDALRSVVSSVCTTDPECDDANPCTDDLCVGGFCSNLENVEPCDDGNPCTDNDICGFGQCRGEELESCCVSDCECDDDLTCTTDVCVANACVFTPVSPGTVCDDGDACTGNDECSAGICAGTSVDCSGLDDECNLGTCNSSNGACEAQPVNEGGACDDGDLCTVGATCLSGICGVAVDCSSLDDSCNAGACNAGTGECETQMLADDTPCDADGDACTADDACLAGVCLAGLPANCDDGNECTDDSCDSGSGCVHTAVGDGGGCDDGFICTVTDQCVAGACSGTESCPPDEVCRSDGECTLPATLVFQDDGSYMGTHDTVLQEGEPNVNNGDLDNWDWDIFQGGTQGETISLLRFDQLICDTVRQIPPGSRIVSATLTIEVLDASASPAADIHLVNVDWDESLATWNNFGGDPGVQPDEYGAFVANAPFTLGFHDIDVTSAVQAWADDPSSNHGLVFLANSTNGAHAYSSESLDPENRPKLTVELVSTYCNVDSDCDDALFCNGSELCVAGVCQFGVPVNCDDDVACTTDSCNDTLGECENLPDHAVCDDGQFCNGDETCDSVSDCVTSTPPSCPGQLCSDALGQCVDCLDDQACDDGDVCNGIETCSGGICVAGTTLNCDDGNPCTDDSCAPVAGCEYVDNTDACDDGDACTGGDTCGAGVCAGSAIDCSGLNDACNVGVCNPGSGSCEAQPVNEGGGCNDGDNCTQIDICSAGVCGGSAVDCSGLSDSCIIGVCNPGTGGCVAQPVNEGGGCNDGDNCTETDTCSAGVCGGSAVDCSGLNDSCNIGVCNPGTGSCVAQPVNEGGGCNDGDNCTETDTCSAGVCGGSAVDCSGLNDSCNIGVCNPDTGSCVAQPVNEGGGCNDGDNCTETDTCLAGVCGGSDVDCSGLSDSCNIGLCHPGTGSCVAQPVNEGGGCNDGDNCTETDTCSAGVCGGSAVDCSGLNDSCNIGLCHPGTGSCVAWPANEGGGCNDGDNCTEPDTCSAGVCGGSAVDCSGLNDACNIGVCNLGTGDCQAQPTNEGGGCNDGDNCTETDTCSAGVCGGSAVDCSGLNDVCSIGVCNPGTGDCQAQPANEGGGCNDGDNCTETDTCSAGVCGGTAVDCSELSDACNIGVCNPGTGNCQAQPANENGDCDDGDACTSDDSCAVGICFGLTANCDDGDACTVDICDSQTGCASTPIDPGVECDDDNLCTVDLCDPVTGCMNEPVDCDDSLSCTTDLCEGTSGLCQNTLEPGNCLIDDGCYADDELNPLNDCEICDVSSPTEWMPSEPTEVTGFVLEQIADVTYLRWDEQGIGFVYDLAGESLATMHADGGLAGTICLADGLSTTIRADPRPDPPADQGFYYLVRSRKSCGAGSFGTDSSGFERLIGACP